MSREHLYKAKRVNWKELPKEEWWVEGNLLISDDDYYIIPAFGVSCAEKLNNYVCDNMITLHAFEVEKETICEYTGLTDKNGRNIFEWDIVECSARKDGYDKYKVIWCKSYADFRVEPIDFGVQFPVADYYGEHINGEKYLVIGNVFDNTELLKG